MRQISKGLTNTIKWRVAQRVTRHFVFLAFCLLCAFYAFFYGIFVTVPKEDIDNLYKSEE